jgi:CelD/BcsL family acetyltransferase involved in cellulose biosynthesis
MTRWTTEVRHDRGVFSELSEWWDRQPIARGLPFLHSKILGCWEDGFEEAGSRLHVLVLQRDGELVAALPLYQARGRLRSLDQEHATWFDVVAGEDPEVDEEIPRWLDSLSLAHLYRMREESPIVAALDSHPRWVVQKILDGPYVDLSAGMEAIRSRLSKEFMRTLRRRRRRLEEMGEIEFVDHPPGPEVGSVLEEGLRLEASGWKGRRGVATFDVPSYERWFRSVAEVAEDEGWLRLSALRLDGRLLAFRYDLVYAGRRFGLITCFDESPDVASMSPGSLLVESVLERSAADGITAYEFGNGRHSWKFDWTSNQRRVYDLLVFGSGPKGRALSMAAGVRRRVSGRRSVDTAV